MSPRRVGVRPLHAVRIILRPALRPMMQLLGGLGIVLTLPGLLLFSWNPEGGTNFQDMIRVIAVVDLQRFNEALQRFRADCGRYPTADEGLAVLVNEVKINGWQGPYLQRVSVDPWRRPYVYNAGTDPPAIVSYGADGRPGGRLYDADISSRESLSDAFREIEAHHEHEQWVWFIGTVLVFSASAYALIRSFWLKR